MSNAVISSLQVRSVVLVRLIHAPLVGDYKQTRLGARDGKTHADILPQEPQTIREDSIDDNERSLRTLDAIDGDEPDQFGLLGEPAPVCACEVLVNHSVLRRQVQVKLGSVVGCHNDIRTLEAVLLQSYHDNIHDALYVGVVEPGVGLCIDLGLAIDREIEAGTVGAGDIKEEPTDVHERFTGMDLIYEVGNILHVPVLLVEPQLRRDAEKAGK